MLDIKFIRNNPDVVKKGCRDKQAKVDIDRLLELDKKRRQALKELETMRAEENRISELVSKEVDSTRRDELIREGKDIKNKSRDHQGYLKESQGEFEELMSQIPNLPLSEVPSGKNESDNVVLREEGKKPKFNFKPKDYLEIAQNLDLIDIQRAAKAAGTRFGYLKDGAALLEFALINLAFEVLTREKFVPVVPPVMLKPEMMAGMGYIKKIQNPKSSPAKIFGKNLCGQEFQNYVGDEVYFLRDDDLLLVGTSEQSIGVMHANEVFQEKDLPKRYAGFSTCFRREAGAYGKDTKGILRVHQFDKVEMFSFCHPEKSKEEHQLLLSMEEKLTQLLKIPYRVVQMCTGDLGDPAAAKYDIEVWMPGQNCYRETHSTSNCTDFQARRLNVRYRDSQTQKLEFVHTLNGTAYAVGRMLIAIIENYQQKDGSILIPKALQKYLDFKIIKQK